MVIDYSEPYKDEIHNLLVKYGLNWTHSPGGIEFYKTGVDDTCNITGYFTKKEYDKLVNWIRRNNISEEIRMMLNSPLGGRRGIGFGLGRSWQRGGFSPTDIAGLQLWLDFSDASTLFVDAGITNVSADGDAIYQANDKSGHGYTFIQAILENRPYYKTGIVNGLSVCRGDGTRRLSETGFILNQPFEVFGVVRKVLGINNPYWFGYTLRMFRLGNDSSVYLGRNLLDYNWDAVAGTWYLFGVEANGANSKIYRDGNNTVSGDAGTRNFEGNCDLLGSGAYGAFEGDAGEIVVYNSILSLTDRQSVNSYLNNKWAIY